MSPYTDKVRARETARLRMIKFRERQKKRCGSDAIKTLEEHLGVTQGVTGVTENEAGVTLNKRLQIENEKYKKWKELSE